MSHIRILDPDSSGDWEVWLNQEEQDEYSGLCIGTAQTREAAIADAMKDIAEVSRDLADLARSIIRTQEEVQE